MSVCYMCATFNSVLVSYQCCEVSHTYIFTASSNCVLSYASKLRMCDVWTECVDAKVVCGGALIYTPRARHTSQNCIYER